MGRGSLLERAAFTVLGIFPALPIVFKPTLSSCCFISVRRVSLLTFAGITSCMFGFFQLFMLDLNKRSYLWPNYPKWWCSVFRPQQTESHPKQHHVVNPMPVNMVFMVFRIRNKKHKISQPGTRLLSGEQGEKNRRAKRAEQVHERGMGRRSALFARRFFFFFLPYSPLRSLLPG